MINLCKPTQSLSSWDLSSSSSLVLVHSYCTCTQRWGCRLPRALKKQRQHFKVTTCWTALGEELFTDVVPGDTARQSISQAPSSWGRAAAHMKTGAVGGANNGICHIISKLRQGDAPANRKGRSRNNSIRTQSRTVPGTTELGLWWQWEPVYNLSICLRMTDLMGQLNGAAMFGRTVTRPEWIRWMGNTKANETQCLQIQVMPFRKAHSDFSLDTLGLSVHCIISEEGQLSEDICSMFSCCKK